MGKVWDHFKTITYHKYLVAQGCFRVGLYRQGLTHDLSKYSPTEFLAGVRYYQGTRSPNNAEREDRGYSTAWMHHKGRNRHHYEYWTDYKLQGPPGTIVPVPMPDRYIAEMIMDRIAACKVYQGKAYTDASPLAYYSRGTVRSPMHPGMREKQSNAAGGDDIIGERMHPDTREKLERMLHMLAEKGERETFACIRRELVEKRKK